MGSSKLKQIVKEEVARILNEAPTPKRFYHSTNSDFVPGKSYKARRGKGSNFGAWFENLVEKQRPKNKFSRKEAFFLVARLGDMDAAGGEGSNLYVVEAPRFSRHHFGWLSRALDLVSGKTSKEIKENREQLDQLIMNYWAGKSWKYDRNEDSAGAVWEYLAPKMKVLKEK